MKGLELSRRYYEEICRPAVEKYFAAHIEKMAFGLVGDVSECYGFDDEISRDHDFGPRIMVWLNSDDFSDHGLKLKEFLKKLPANFRGYDGVNTSQYGNDREGVFTITGFYKRFTGLEHIPTTIHEWRLIPETNLSIATNGEVFNDPPGEFSRYRKHLLEGYPEDVRLKMMSARCMKIAQSGQYNYPRSLRRKEFVAAQMALSEFIDSAISMIYLLNNRYKPFYKWMHKGLKNLPLLGEEAYHLFSNISSATGYYDNIPAIEDICSLIINQLRENGFSDSPSDFLLDHGPVIQLKIKNEYLRKMAPWG